MIFQNVFKLINGNWEYNKQIYWKKLKILVCIQIYSIYVENTNIKFVKIVIYYFKCRNYNNLNNLFCVYKKSELS